MGSALELRILGPVEVLVDGAGPVSLGGRRQRALLVILALHANKVVSADRLVDQLWGEQPPAQPLHTLQVFVSRLRRALGLAAARLATRQSGYALELLPGELDADHYERLYLQAREALAANAPQRAAERLAEASAMWRGAPLTEFTYEPFAQGAIARLEELHASCREELIEAELALGRHVAVIPALEALVHEQPFRERPRGQLMLALYRCGRQADALEAYQHARRALLEELAVEPGSSLRELEQAILRQDPSLLVPGAADPVAVSVDTPAPVSEAPEPPSAELSPDRVLRKTVTVLVTSFRTAPTVDPETARGLVAAARGEVETVVGRHGGVVVAGLGREVVAVFGFPLIREDDALRALRAAQELLASGPAARTQLAVRIGIDTGEVVTERQSDLFGAPLDGALELAREAPEAVALVSDVTRRLAGEAIEAEPDPASGGWRLAGVDPGTQLPPRHAGGELIAREDELRLARDAFGRVEASATPHLVTVVGEPGIGKSRLIQELVSELPERATVLQGRCLSYGDGVALWPLREAFAALAGEESRAAVERLLEDGEDAGVVAGIVTAALGFERSDGVGEQIPWAFRRALERLAARSPVILVIDDVHWAAPTLLDLVEYVVDWTVGPILLVCLARPELLELRPRWGGGQPRMSSIVVGPLADDDARRLLESQPGVTSLTPALTARILEAADGNPLFVEQLLAISQEDPDWHLRTEIPASVTGLLAARLDRLGPGERAFIECASVMGREFPPAAVIDLLPAEARSSAEQHLRALVRRGLVHPERSTLVGEQALRFHHLLVRDVAYRSAPKSLRAELHEGFADWVAARGEGTQEFVGYHLGQALGYRRELGAGDAELAPLAGRTMRALARAGRQALARGDTNGGIALLERAAAPEVSIGGRDAGVLLDLGSALLERGDFDRARQVLGEAVDAAVPAGAESLAARASIELSYLRALVDPTVQIGEIQATADQAIAVFNRTGDQSGLSRAWLHIGEIHWTRLQCADMETVLERALRHADIAEDARARSRILRDLARATVIGPRPVQAGVRRCESILARAGDDAPLVAVTETMLGVLAAMGGEFERARGLHNAAAVRLEQVGLTVTAAQLRMYRAFIELLAGTPGRAIPDVVEACTVLERIGERRRLATTAALLARLLHADGRYHDAEHFSAVSQESVSQDDVVSLVVWRGTRGLLAARAGQGPRALELVDGAVELAGRTDFLVLHADALCERARVLELLGRREQAGADWEAAIGLYERKGATAAVARARAARSPEAPLLDGRSESVA